MKRGVVMSKYVPFDNGGPYYNSKNNTWVIVPFHLTNPSYFFSCEASS
jgi:hypothetical protein